MKIVKDGIPNSKEPVYTGECRYCGCVVECLKSEATFEDRPASGPYIECPTAGCVENGRKNRIHLNQKAVLK